MLKNFKKILLGLFLVPLAILLFACGKEENHQLEVGEEPNLETIEYLNSKGKGDLLSKVDDIVREGEEVDPVINPDIPDDPDLPIESKKDVEKESVLVFLESIALLEVKNALDEFAVIDSEEPLISLEKLDKDAFKKVLEGLLKGHAGALYRLEKYLLLDDVTIKRSYIKGYQYMGILAYENILGEKCLYETHYRYEKDDKIVGFIKKITLRNEATDSKEDAVLNKTFQLDFEGNYEKEPGTYNKLVRIVAKDEISFVEVLTRFGLREPRMEISFYLTADNSLTAVKPAKLIVELDRTREKYPVVIKFDLAGSTLYDKAHLEITLKSFENRNVQVLVDFSFEKDNLIAKGYFDLVLGPVLDCQVGITTTNLAGLTYYGGVTFIKKVAEGAEKPEEIPHKISGGFDVRVTFKNDLPFIIVRLG